MSKQLQTSQQARIPAGLTVIGLRWETSPEDKMTPWRARGRRWVLESAWWEEHRRCSLVPDSRSTLDRCGWLTSGTRGVDAEGSEIWFWLLAAGWRGSVGLPGSTSSGCCHVSFGLLPRQMSTQRYRRQMRANSSQGQQPPPPGATRGLPF